MSIFSKPKRVFHRFITDFMDLNSKGIYPERAGSTQWVMTSDDQDYDALNDRYRKDGIARKVVAKPAEDATRNGWRIVIPDDQKKQAVYQKAMDQLDLKEVLTRELVYQRLDGDGYITFLLKQAGNPSLYDPVDPQNVIKLTAVHAFGQNHVEKIMTNDDPTSDDYLQESKLIVRQTQSSTGIDQNGFTVPEITGNELQPIVIDPSRYMHITMDRLEDDYTGTSVITRCKDQLDTMQTALYSVDKMLFEYVLKIMKSNSMTSESKDDFDKDKQTFSQGMNSEAVVFLAEDESLEKLTTNPSGIRQLLDFAWQQLCAASNIPKSVLLGEQAGSLAGASQDVVNYYDMVKSMQEELLKPQIEYIVKLLMWSQAIGDGYEDPDSFDWHIEFRPLYSPDDKTQSETFLNYANALSTLVGAGIKDAGEASQMLDSQSNNQNQGMQTSQNDSTDPVMSEDEINQYLKDEKMTSHDRKP